MTVEEFRNLQRKADPFAPLFPDLSETAGKVIIGFDPHASTPGVAAYDAREGKVHAFETIKKADMKEWLEKTLSVPGFYERAFARVEMPTRQTTYGHIQRMTKAAGRNRFSSKFEKQVFGIIWNSSKGETIAEDFIEILKSCAVPFEVVRSDDRINCETLRYAKGKSGPALETYFSTRALKTGFRIFPSKMKAETARHFYGTRKPGNKESRDALLLSFPEVIYKKFG